MYYNYDDCGPPVGNLEARRVAWPHYSLEYNYGFMGDEEADIPPIDVCGNIELADYFDKFKEPVELKKYFLGKGCTDTYEKEIKSFTSKIDIHKLKWLKNTVAVY